MSQRQYDILIGLLIAAAVIVAGVLVFIWYQEYRAERPQPPTAEDDSWQRVQTAGRLLAGTAADYPPFAYYNDDFQLDGFDVALIREIGQRLGVQAEIKDQIFDSLNNELQLGNIDVAIAAISVTADRNAVVDFSSVYYVSQDAVLFRDGDPTSSIGSVNDLASRRIGVERGSVFENWLQTTLVDPGLMPAGNLLAYQKAEHALRDLREERNDAVIMDLPPAEAAVAAGGVKLVAQGLNPQAFAIALPKGARTLQAQINSALLSMQNDGRLVQLIQQYLRVPPEQILPTPSPNPTPTPGPTTSPPPCVDGLSFVQDLSYDDRNMTVPPIVPPGQVFSKGWRVRNSGTCTWDASYVFRFVGGNTPAAQMNGQPTAVVGTVPPGATYDIYVNLIAPLAPGTYQGFWAMHNGRNQAFGDRVWVGIRVPAPATVTPPPTQTPAPGINFTVDRTNIQQGECVTFSWNTQNVRQVYFYRDGEPWQQNQVGTQGSRVECPPYTLGYFLRVVKPDNSVETRQITIYVTPVTDAPRITQFVAAPPQVTAGQCINMQWNVEGDVENVSISGNGTLLWATAPVRGRLQNCPANVGTTEYVLMATGPGGSSTARQYVGVNAPSTATPVPTAAPSAPIINAFGVTPDQVQVNECVRITWTTSGGTTGVRLLRDRTTLLDNANLSGTLQDCPATAGTVVYRLEASNGVGETAVSEAPVGVVTAPEENPLANTSWTLTGINGNATLAGTTLGATFGGDGQVNGFGGCNNFSAGYAVSGSNITVGAPISSSLACASPPGVMEQEAAYFNLLPQAVRFEQPARSGLLLLYNSAGEEILRYVLR